MESLITVSGLTGTVTPSGPIQVTQIVANATAHVLQIKSSNWSVASGSLELGFNSSLLPFEVYVLAFDVCNQAPMQDARHVDIEMSGSIALLRQRIRSDVGNFAPLLIGGFSVKNVSQSTALRNALNTVYVTLVLNIDLGTSPLHIHLSGLNGSQTPDTSTLNLTSSDEKSLHVISQYANWEQTSGVLSLTILPFHSVVPQGESVAAKTIRASNPMVFSFQLINPASAHSSGQILVRGSSDGVIIASAAAMARGQGYRAPLFVANFLVATIAQVSCMYAWNENTCVCVCVRFIYVYTHTHRPEKCNIHTFTHTNLCTHTHTRTHIYVHTHTNNARG